MDDWKRTAKGSERRDAFKLKHKECGGNLYATDADLCLVEKRPPGTVAYLDYKAPSDSITFAEVIQYNEWMKQAPVYIVEGENPEVGPFVIKRYLGGDWGPHPPDVSLEDETKCPDWDAFWQWERELRVEYRKRGGWKGRLRTIEDESND
jgi:hypothetical protein